MKSFKFCIVALFTLILTASAHADVKQHPIGLQIWVPDTWITEIDEGLLMTNSPDEGVIVILMVLNSRDVNMAADEMDSELAKIFQNIQATTDVEEIVINGLTGYTQEGTGVTDGIPVSWLTGLFPYRNHALMVLGFAESAKYASYEQMLIEIFSSLRAY